MSPAETTSELSPSAEMLVRLAREELGEMSVRHRAEGRLKVNAHYVSRTPRRGRFVARFAATMILGATMVVGLLWLRGHATQEISYVVQGGRIDATGFVQRNGEAEPTLRFSDGTQVAFLAGAQVRIKSVSQDGARIQLSGKIDVSVVPKARGHWLFDAGPFVILVTGTAFKAEWREAEQRLEIQLKTGAIQVSGASLHEPIALKAGQSLVISAREKQVAIRDPAGLSPAKAATSAQHEALPGTAPSPSPARAEPASPSGSTTVPARSNWTTELVAGRFSLILEEAEQRGLDSVLAAGSSDELAALSDAARYSRREDVARRALAAQRRRFPKSSRAHDAAFLLGRLEEAAQHPELALDWYDRCLNEAPRSTYASEALGRKMTLAQRLHGAARARPIAQEYLRRFETGTYAAAAQALLRAP